MVKLKVSGHYVIYCFFYLLSTLPTGPSTAIPVKKSEVCHGKKDTSGAWYNKKYKI